MNEEFQGWEQPTAVSAAGPAATESGAGAAGANKRIVTIRLDIDMLDWFKAQGPGYQTRINQLLRSHMEAARDKAE